MTIIKLTKRAFVRKTAKPSLYVEFNSDEFNSN